MKYYEQALHHLNSASQASLLPFERVARAECLAYLDPREYDEAEEATEKAVRDSGNDPNVLQTAALVDAVVGRKNLAFDKIEKALKRGVQPRWFQLPAFRPLKNEPEYQRLMGKTLGATLSR
jgi:hypothetical protein